MKILGSYSLPGQVRFLVRDEDRYLVIRLDHPGSRIEVRRVGGAGVSAHDLDRAVAWLCARVVRLRSRSPEGVS